MTFGLQPLLVDSAPDVPAPPRAGSYRTILADPPWLERGGGKIKRGADRHYPLMPTATIRALPVSRWAAPDAHLYLWVTNAFLQDGLLVMRDWGFRYVTKIDWFKGDLDDAWIDTVLTNTQIDEPSRGKLIAEADASLEIGLGQYFRGCTESCLFGVRGACEYRFIDGKRAQGRTGFHAPRQQHSAKPEKFRTMVERVSHGPCLEMFARRAAPNWDAWGQEALQKETQALREERDVATEQMRRHWIENGKLAEQRTAIHASHDALRAALEEMGWRPIETAPKDGTAVIGFDPTRESEWMGGVEFMRWLDGAWLDPATHTMKATHWMPLPDSPFSAALAAADRGT